MLSQAEHDPMATAILITTSERLAGEVAEQDAMQAAPLERCEIAVQSINSNGTILIVESMEEAADISNKIGPEHLELIVQEPWSLIPRIRHAGAVFLGNYSPEPVGDYIAGPNHVLPTMGTSRFSSALGVETFLKRTSIISYSKEAFVRDAGHVMRLARIEGLTAHERSVKARLDSMPLD
jgi:histidinol dehydrogenase